jgi:NADH-quinone oxidoreductase subunit G
MPKLKIDGREIEVTQGMKVIEAAARLGIIIPRFCYHSGLGSVGACRMCAVKFLEGPVKGIQMSCMVDACDGMVVSTTDEEAVDFRKHVIEWLMMNHPHDCPVCDEGGHCLLQDMTVAGGHGLRRYLGKKRTYRDQALGVFVQHEMNRCIHCWRCRRFYQEFAGYRDLGGMQIASHTYFGRFKDGPLESPFAGNLIDLCPTGVYTDKPSRFAGRRWDFERGPSLCIHCSLGCNAISSVRYREIVRLESRFNESVNGHFICDRGRYGFYYANHPERPRHSRMGTEEVPLNETVQRAAKKLLEIRRTSGPQSIACFGSTRSSLENQAMLIRISEFQGLQTPGFFETREMAYKVKRAVSRLDERLAVSMREMERSDFILVVGADPVNEAPMLALALRQAFRNGARVVVMDPRPLSLPFEFDHLPVAPRALGSCMSGLVSGAIDRSLAEKASPEAFRFYEAAQAVGDSTLRERVASLASHLRQSRFPVIVCGTTIVRETTPDLAADNGLLLRAAKERAGLFYLMPGANAFGAALLASAERSWIDVIEAVEEGAVKALLIVESDPFWSFPDRERLKQAMDRLDLLLVMDYLPSNSARLAHIFLPTQTIFETETSFVNQEGRAQFAPAAYRGGIPISQISAGNHPPRFFRHDIPGGEPEPAWEILAKLSDAMGSPGGGEIPLSGPRLWDWIVTRYPAFAPYANVQSREERPEGIRVTLGQEKGSAVFSASTTQGESEPEEEDSLELLVVDWTFGTEELSAYSGPIQKVEESPRLFMHPLDASRLGLEGKSRCVLHLDGGSFEVDLRVVHQMAPGVIVLPGHRQLPWQIVKRWPIRVKLDQIGPLNPNVRERRT